MKKSIFFFFLLFLTCNNASTAGAIVRRKAALGKHPVRREGCQIRDITHLTHTNMPCFDCLPSGSDTVYRVREGIYTITGKITVKTHLGTHVDAPVHIFKELLNKTGYKVDSLNLKTLMGPVLVVETPKLKNIDAEVMKSLSIPPGTERVIFKTSNTDLRFMDDSFFHPEYFAFTEDGAKCLVKHTDITFIGIDYMSVAVHDQVVPVRKTLLKSKKIIPVENLKLDGIAPGLYSVICLPMMIATDGAPVRCVLVDPSCL